MKKSLYTYFILALSFSLLFPTTTFAQSITYDNVPPFGTGSTAIGVSGGIVFNFTTNKPIIIENFRCASTVTTVYTATVWYNPVKIFGQPVIANMNAAGGWINLGSAPHAGAGTAALATIPVNLNLKMNPGDTFGFFLQFSGGNVYSTSTLVTPTFTNGTVTIIADNDCAFTRNATAWFGPPRQLNGGVIYRLAAKGQNDASISQLVSPLKFCGASNNLSVKLSNPGRNIINNVNVEWMVDGVPQPTVAFASPLDTIGHPTNPSDTNLNLGSISYSPNQVRNILVWTSSPNGGTDTITNNDTLRLSLRRGLNGTYTIGSTASDFTTFKSAINAIDSFGRCGPLVFNVAAGETFSTLPLSLTNLDSITFQKFGTGANPVVNGLTGIAATDAVFEIAGSKNIVFDGIDVVDNASNTTAATQMEYGYAIINSSATVGSSNNTIKNCKVKLNRTNTVSIGILQSASATGGGIVPTALSGANHNNRYENVRVENSYNGILLQGTAAFPDSNNVITSTGGDTTIIGAATPNDIGNGTAVTYGIQCAEQRNVEVSKCVVRNITHTAALIGSGIWLSNGTATTDYGTANISYNRVHNLHRTTAAGTAPSAMIGIRIEAALLAKSRVYNNIVYALTSANTTISLATAQTLRGISYGQTTGTGPAEFYYNSVSIDNTNAATSVVGFWRGLTGTCILKNNIFSVNSVASTLPAKHHAIYVSAGTVTSSNNVYWSSPTANGFMGSVVAVDKATLAQFTAATSTTAPTDGNEQGSAFANPNFISTTNLDFSAATPAANSGIPVTTPFAITTDFIGTARSTTAPSIGAFETTQPLFDSAAPVITNVFAINSATPAVYATITDNSGSTAAGNVQLWYRVGTSGPFTGVFPDSIPVSSMNGTYKWGPTFAALTPGVYQYYIAVRDIAGPGMNISVNPVQASTFTNFLNSDPVNYATNPDPAVNTRSFSKLSTIPGGTYSVGPTGTYAKLTNVATTLNAAELTGNIIFELQAGYDGTTGETFPLTFNQFGTSGGNWTVTIRPAVGATALQVKGANTTTIFDLNGAKRIKFDGRPGGVGTTSQLSFINTANTGSVVRFINDAQNDTLRYINIADSNTSATSGNIFFSTTNVGTAIANGNSNNLIDNCSINGLSNTVNCIYSSGSASPADNKNNTITNCNIFDFFSNTVAAVNGVLLEAGNTGWNIGTAGNGNKFYQTATRNSTSVPALTIAVGFRAIQINSATVNGCSIVGNRIGGNIAGIPASTFIIGDNVGATAFLLHYIRAIDIVAAGTTTATSIQGNTVSDITVFSGLTGTTAGFAGIHVLSGIVNTGNIAGNTIGAPTGTGSITIYYKNTSAGVNYYGIRYAGANTGLIQNNSIGSLSADAAATGSIQLLCLYLSGTYASPITVSNNLIGSLTTAHSIQAMPSSTNPVNIMGIVTSAATGAAINITGNTVMNLSSFCTSATNTNGLKGIYITGANSVGSTISGNTIRKLYSVSTNVATDQSSAIVGINSTSTGAGPMVISGNTVSALVSGTSTTAAVNIMGIYYASASTATTNRIDNNLIHSLSASPTNAAAVTMSGITQGAGTTRILIANNMVSLGFDSTGASATGAHQITGIQKLVGSINTTVFNTVKIGGTGVANGVSSSFAYKSTGVGNDSLLNNMFINTRTNATTGGTHYAISLGATTTLLINRNLYTGGAMLGQLNGIDYMLLSNWKTATGQDFHSINVSVDFISNTDLHLTGSSLGNTVLVAIPIAGLPTDFDGQTRHAVLPYKGADEPAIPLPVALTSFDAQKLNEHNVSLTWATATEKNSSHFDVQRSLDGKDFEALSKVKAAGNSSIVRSYSYEDLSSPLEKNNLMYYRLKMVDRDGLYEYSNIVSVNKEQQSDDGLYVYPNPFNKDVTVIFESTTETEMHVEVTDITGKTMGVYNQQANIGKNTIGVNAFNNLPSGFYFMTVNIGNSSKTIKLIKE